MQQRLPDRRVGSLLDHNGFQGKGLAVFRYRANVIIDPGMPGMGMAVPMPMSVAVPMSMLMDATVALVMLVAVLMLMLMVFGRLVFVVRGSF